MKKDFLQQVADYIESIGGKAVVIGGTRIRQGYPKYNFTLEVDFTGKSPKAKIIKSHNE